MSGLALCWSRTSGASVNRDVRERIEAALPRAAGERVVRWNAGAEGSAGPVWMVQASRDGAGPVIDADGTVLAVDGRLDATADLGLQAADLGAPVNRRNQAALRAARRRWGERFWERLIGDYALLMWQPDRQTLTCGRDPVGVRPLYYGFAGGDVVVSTALACVLAHPGLPRVANEGMVAEIIADAVVSREETLYRHAKRVPAGHALDVRQDRVTLRRFRSPQAGPLLRYRRQEEYEEHYRSVLGEAVADRLQGVGSAAVELSGGLDSSSVAAVVAGQLKPRNGAVSAYSLVYPGLVEDERPYIDRVAKLHHLNSHVIQPPPPPPGRLLDEISRSGDLPVPPNFAAWPELAGAAVANGSEVVLSGQGGDQSFTNSSWYPADSLRRGRVRASVAAARRLSPQRPAAQAVLTHSVRPLAGLVARAVRLRPTALSPPPWVGARFALDVGLTDRLATRSPVRSARAEHHSITVDGFEARLLEFMAHCADGCGIGYRHPFYDLRVIEFALALPESQLWVGDEGRSIQRRSLARVLPPAVRSRRSKAEFSHLFAAEFERQGGRRRFANLRISDMGWTDPLEVLQLYDQMEASTAGNGWVRHIWPLWQILVVDEWARHAL